MRIVPGPREDSGGTATVCFSSCEPSRRVAPGPREDGGMAVTVRSSPRFPGIRIAPGLHEDGGIVRTFISTGTRYAYRFWPLQRRSHG